MKFVENMSNITTFWDTLPRPIIGLSPMNGVTDHAFRHIQKKHGNPMLLFTEFTSVDGICAGARALLKDFLYDESQRPIIGQIYGRVPGNFYQTALVLCQLGFDGIDINMGCPSKSVASSGAGAGLIRTPELAQEIVRATKQAVSDWQNGATVHDCVDVPASLAQEVISRHVRLPVAFQKPRPVPVSVKTRIGYAESQVEEWIPRLLETEPAAISLHGRTLTQGYAGDADWDVIGRAAEIAHGSDTPLLGNGDLRTLDDAHARIGDYGVDGALIGRASYGNPYVFRADLPQAGADQVDSQMHSQMHSDPTHALDAGRYDVLHIALEHARLYEASFSHLDRYMFLPMRKHLGWYVRHLPGASHLRRTLLQTSSLDEAVGIIEEYLDYRQVWDRQNAEKLRVAV
ncbi:MAG: tRNA-dihydrouridine synthase [Litorilinea sp.]